MKRNLIVLWAGLGALSCGCSRQASHRSSPPPDLEFPASVQLMQELRDAPDENRLRAHAWSVFERLVRDVGDGRSLWETWPSVEETIAGHGGAKDERVGLEAPDKLKALGVSRLRAVEAPPDGICDGFSRDFLLTSVRFSPSAAAHILNCKHQYNDVSALDNLRQRGTDSIEEFPRDAVAIKAVWWPVDPSELTPLPIWTEPTARPPTETMTCRGNSFLRWETIFAIEPLPAVFRAANDRDLVVNWDPEGAPLAINGTSRVRNPRYVPLSKFHVRRLTDTEVHAPLVNLAFNRVLRRDARSGDLVALVAMHLATKELPDWLWATFWWSGDPAERSQLPGLRSDPVWSNFALRVAARINRPEGAENQPNYVFSPWLEAPMSRGTTSNCIDCHQRAVWHGVGGVSLPPVSPKLDKLPHDNVWFKGGVRLDYLWSLEDRHSIE